MVRTEESIKQRRLKYLEKHPEATICVECGKVISDFTKAERYGGVCSECYSKNHGVVWIPQDENGHKWLRVDRDKGTKTIVEESFAELETELELTPLKLKFGKLRKND